MKKKVEEVIYSSMARVLERMVVVVVICSSQEQVLETVEVICNMEQVEIKIKMVSGSPSGMVALELKRAGANWFELDK